MPVLQAQDLHVIPRTLIQNPNMGLERWLRVKALTVKPEDRGSILGIPIEPTTESCILSAWVLWHAYILLPHKMIIITFKKRPGMLVRMCNPGAERAEIGESLELAANQLS